MTLYLELSHYFLQEKIYITIMYLYKILEFLQIRYLQDTVYIVHAVALSVRTNASNTISLVCMCFTIIVNFFTKTIANHGSTAGVKRGRY